MPTKSQPSYNFLTSDEDILKYCKKEKIKIGHIHSDGTVDVDGDVKLQAYTHTKFRIKFGRVSGDFDCSHNSLKSLFGGPKEVGGEFLCQYNWLTSLIGSPEYVGGNFFCFGNNFSSLLGSPKFINGDFRCGQTVITNLVGSPNEVGGDFICVDNLRLTSLEGCPSVVKGQMEFSGSINLWNTSGVRDTIVGGEVDFRYTSMSCLVRLFKNFSDFKDSLDYNYVRLSSDGKPAINLFRFKQVLEEFSPAVWNRGKIQFGKYIYINDNGLRVDFDGNLI